VKAFVFAAIAGALFATGLVIGGMTNPAKITGFVDVGGAWDPQLGFVMAAAIAVYAPLMRYIRRRTAPLIDTQFHWPAAGEIDGRLVGGAAIFGVGWGLSGYCPGPALTSVVGGAPSALVFVAAMMVGLLLARTISSPR
jgi:uncharacterized protein